MKIRGNAIGTTIEPKKVLVKCENLTPEEKARARANIGGASEEVIGDIYEALGEIIEIQEEVIAGGGGGGADGFSPIATVEETVDGAIITITDKNGTTTATVKNGNGGALGVLDDGMGNVVITGVEGDNTESQASYYSTTREEIGVSHENINTDYIFSLYDALVEEYPDNIRKITIKSDDESFTNYAYEISTGEYCPTVKTVYGTQFSADEHIKKPKHLVLNAFHGSERKTVFSTYRFIRDVLKGHNVPQVFKEGAAIQVLPVANPTGFNAFEYRKPNGVDINHNFDWNWEEENSSGAYPASEPETQVITKWLNDNSDAELFIDFHNNGMVNENVAIIGTPNNDDIERVKKIALRGIDRVIPFWRDVIGYDSFVVPVMGETSITDEREEKDVIFAYSVSAEVGGSAFSYAQNVLGIPSFVMETSSYYGDYDEWKANETAYPAETIAMGAEALGNILIELFESCEVNNMTEVNEKLDTILQGVSFREVKGQLVVNATTGADIIYADGTIDATTGDLIPVEGKSALRIKLPIPNGARIVCIKADAETETAIKTTQTKYFVQATVDFSPIGYLMSENIFPHTLWEYDESTSKGHYTRGVSKCYNTDGFNVSTTRLKAGTYNWTAYYWNE